MSVTSFDRDATARWYANQHLQTDPGVRAVYYLPAGAPEREIRFVEVNELIPEWNGEKLEPVDFGVDVGSEKEHKLFVLDVTSGQWERIRGGSLRLPGGWLLDDAMEFHQS